MRISRFTCWNVACQSKSLYVCFLLTNASRFLEWPNCPASNFPGFHIYIFLHHKTHCTVYLGESAVWYAPKVYYNSPGQSHYAVISTRKVDSLQENFGKMMSTYSRFRLIWLDSSSGTVGNTWKRESTFSLHNKRMLIMYSIISVKEENHRNGRYGK